MTDAAGNRSVILVNPRLKVKNHHYILFSLISFCRMISLLRKIKGYIYPAFHIHT